MPVILVPRAGCLNPDLSWLSISDGTENDTLFKLDFERANTRVVS